MTTGQKKQYVDESPIYALEIKKILLSITEEDVHRRMRVEEVMR